MTTQPIIFDLVNNVVLRVGENPDADRRYAAIVAAQQQASTAASGFKKHDD